MKKLLLITLLLSNSVFAYPYSKLYGHDKQMTWGEFDREMKKREIQEQIELDNLRWEAEHGLL